jgi:hypothetical protein
VHDCMSRRTCHGIARTDGVSMRIRHGDGRLSTWLGRR